MMGDKVKGDRVMSNESRIADSGSSITHDRLPITDYPKVAIIILNWNGWKDTIECLESLYRITYPNYDVIVVDNGSEDESIEKIKEYCEGKIKVESKFFEYSSENKPIKIIEYTREEAEAGGGKEKEIADLPSNRRMIIIKNEKNYGFAEGNNIGMRYALKALNPSYVLLLNNDTVVDKGFLTKLIEVGEIRNDVGALSSFVYEYDRPDTIQQGGEKIRWFFRSEPIKIWKQKPYEEVIECQIASGACVLIKKGILYKVGLLSTDFPLLYSDLDFYLRVLQVGYTNVSVRNSVIWHKTSRSVKKIPYFLIQQKIRDNLVLRYKHLSAIKFAVYLIFVYPYRILLTFFAYFPKYPNKQMLLSLLKGISDAISYIFKDITR